MTTGQLSAMIAGLMMLTACATATPYQPAGDNQRGFADQQIESDRWQVSFAGNSLTDRRTVETYLLYRAAELTAQQGFDHFRVVQRETDEDSTFVPTGFSGSPYYSGFYCDYAFFGPHGRYRGYSPYGYPAHASAFPSRRGYYDPFGYGFGAGDFREIVRYEARAEIIMGRGDKPKGDPAYFSAEDVLANLSGTILRPEA